VHPLGNRWPRGSTVTVCASLALLAVSGGGTQAHAQEDEGVRLGITYRPGYVPALAITDIEAEAPFAAVAAAIDSVIALDLDYSDRFEILPVPDSLRAGSAVNYGLWNQLGAVWLVEGTLTVSGQQAMLRIGLHDVVYGSLKEVQAFTLPPVASPDFRMAVHRISDAVVEWATGEPGMAASKIAFSRRAADGTWDIHVVDSDGRGVQRATRRNALVFSPAFSPDGGHIAYQYQSNSGDESGIYDLDIETGQTSAVTSGSLMHLTPAFAPDGSRILFARFAPGGTEIFEVDRSGGRPRTLTSTAIGDALGPTMAPDGRRFAFTGSAVGAPQIYVQEGAGERPRLISRFVRGADSYATSPDWNPLDDRIVYQSRVQGQFQIVVVNADGSEMRLLTSEGRNEDPSWAPDGRHIVFSSDRGGYHGLWVLDTVTGRTRNLLRNNDDQLPDWSGALDFDP
jgi:TolB protein